MRFLAAGVVLSLVVAGCGHPAQSAPSTGRSSQTPTGTVSRVIAAPVDPDPRVGAFFLSDNELHACTGSVLHSPAGDLVLTAAHCLITGALARFAPGFARGAAPEDLWTVDALYLDPRWLATKDPRADYAIVRVSRPSGGSLEASVGSALSLGAAPPRGSQVTVVAYPAGVGGLPVGCQVTTGVSDGGFPELPCAGLVDGTSGAPWISGSTVTGVIGGLHGGGCAENLSYSAPFDAHTTALLTRAQAGGPGDVSPSSFDDQC
ncbi:trypsin-like serine protease [Mycobacterium sp.]|uniref:trypsin-like serine peptidase n=1 Tax=Mycobacterium sp. TaxID=1785 RepID=UPI0025DF8B53|nr:trypsin-like serine protease [Mycobacterium sp.]